MEKPKFRFVSTSILNDVEEMYLRFIGDNHELSEKELLDKFKELNQSPNHITGHAEIMVNNHNKLIIQTSKFNRISKEYYDPMLWVFIKQSSEKYSWTLSRFRIKG